MWFSLVLMNHRGLNFEMKVAHFFVPLRILMSLYLNHELATAKSTK